MKIVQILTKGTAHK